MAFTDLPRIDAASRQSERSERKLKDFFNNTTGFILRPDVPDYGCDFDAELIHEGATNWRVPIQLKSIAEPSFIEGGQFLSYSFPTSRLGYLIRRMPAGGLIAIYSGKDDKVYFELADIIFQALKKERESDEWMSNDKINIRIPANNLLTTNSTTEIHQTFLGRFQRAQQMQRSHGANYDLPQVNLDSNAPYDFNNLEDVKKAIRSFGLFLLTRHDQTMIYDMVSRIPNMEIYADKDLLIAAAIAYGEAGHYTEALVFIDRLNRSMKLSDTERHMVRFAELKAQLSLTRITTAEFIQSANELAKEIEEGPNQICIEINITFFELLKPDALVRSPREIFISIEEVFQKIEKLKIDEANKNLLEVWNAENLANLTSLQRFNILSEVQLLEMMRVELSIEERRRRAYSFYQLERSLFERIDKLNKKAESTGNKLLKAHTLAFLSRFTLVREMDIVSFGTFPGLHNKNIVLTRIDNAIEAYKNFTDTAYYDQAYNALSTAMELMLLARDFYNYTEATNNHFDQVENAMKNLEVHLGRSRPKFQIPGLIEKVKSDEKQPFGEMNDDQLNFIAHSYHKSLNLPKEHLINVKIEFEGFRTFSKRCKDGKLELLPFRRLGVVDKDRYAYPPLFVLLNKQTEIQSLPDTNLDKLLTNWGY